MKKFVICIKDLVGDEERKINQWISEHGQWWHWLPNLWLFVDPNDKTAADIRNGITQTIGKHVCVVLEVEPRDWATTSFKDEKGNDMTTWLDSTWDPVT